MQTKIPLFVLCMIILAFAACNDSSEKTSNNSGSTTTSSYVVSGRVADSAASYWLSHPVYWKGDVLNLLSTTDTLPYGTCGDVSVDGTDLYIGGEINNIDFSVMQPVYWKNENLNSVTLPSNCNKGGIWRITFDASGNWYASGWASLTSTGSNTPGYWYNGTWKALDATLSSGTATVGTTQGGVTFFNGDMYQIGYLKDPVSGLKVPVYWKNGIVNEISMSSVSGATYGANVWSCSPSKDDSTMEYFVTYYDASSNFVPTIMSGGSFSSLPTGSKTNNGVGWGKTISPSGDQYTAGIIGETKTPTPAFWKNYILTPLPTGTASYGKAGGATFSGTDVYISGYVFSCTYNLDNDGVDGISIPVYWKNAQLVKLSTGLYPGGMTDSAIMVNF